MNEIYGGALRKFGVKLWFSRVAIVEEYDLLKENARFCPVYLPWEILSLEFYDNREC